MQRSGTAYTLGFAAAVCVVCSILVSGSAVLLKGRQDLNVTLDRQRNVLSVSDLVDPGKDLSGAEVQRIYEESVVARLVDLETGAYADDAVEGDYDMVAAAKDPELGRPAPENPAGVTLLPKYATVFQVMKDGRVDRVILQVWGRGLWSTMYGYLALDTDCNTIRGLTFYEQGETPGLGGEVDNPEWKKCWPGRTAYNEQGNPAIAMRKGGAGPVEADPHGFDAISGATITSRSVEHLLNFWLGEHGYKPYLDRIREAM